MNIFTTGSYFKSFVSLNGFASSCHTSLSNFSLSHTKEPEWLSLAVTKTTWISWNTLKWNFCGISWTHSGLQPVSLGHSDGTQDKGSTDALSHRVLQRSEAVCSPKCWEHPGGRMALGNNCALHLLCDHGHISPSTWAEQVMIHQQFAWKHSNEWW